MDKTLLKISDITNIENSYIAILAKFNNDISKYGIIYNDPVEKKRIQLFNSTFATLYKQLVANFHFGFTIGAIVGLARERTPADQWQSDTIERSLHDKNSIHQGILRIITKEDGIPVFINSTRSVGNIAPALAYLHKGNPVEIRKALNKYNLVQANMMAKILEGKPACTNENLIASYSAGEGYKSAHRHKTISKVLDNLTLSEDPY